MFKRFLKFLFTGNLVFDIHTDVVINYLVLINNEIQDKFGKLFLYPGSLRLIPDWNGYNKVILSKTHFDGCTILTKLGMDEHNLRLQYQIGMYGGKFEFCKSGLRLLYGYIPDHIYFAIEKKQ